VRYYNDFVKPQKVFRLPDDQERGALEALVEALQSDDAALAVIAQKNAQEGKDMPLPAVNWSDDEFLQSCLGQSKGRVLEGSSHFTAWTVQSR